MMAIFSLSIIGCGPINVQVNFDENTIEGLIGITARKYIENFNDSRFAKECNLNDKVSCTHDELLNAIRLAFGNNLPEFSGERKYAGYFGDVVKSRDLTEKEEENSAFLHNIGLIEKEYNPDEILDMDDAKVYMSRLYRYFGNNYKDDFGRAMNYDFFYNDINDSDWTYDKKEYKEKTLDNDRVQDNVEKIYLEMKENQYEPSVANVDQYYYGDAVYDIKKDEYFIGQLNDIQNCKNIDELAELEAQFQELNSINAFGLQTGRLYTANKNDGSLAEVICRLGLGEIVFTSDEETYEKRFETKMKNFEELLTKFSPLEEQEISDYMFSYRSIVNSLHLYCVANWSEYCDINLYTYFNDLVINVDGSLGQGIFECFFGDFGECTYAVMPINEMLFNYFLIFYVCVEQIPFETFRDFCYVSYIAENKSFLDRIANGKLDKYLLTYLTEFSIMGYYQHTDAYSENLNYCIDMIDDIKEEYKNTINNSDNISSVGKEALIDKIENIDYTIMLNSSDSAYNIEDEFEYEYTGSLFKDYVHNKNFICSHFERVALDGEYRFESFIFSYDLFISNAMYHSSVNSISLYCGAVLCPAVDYSTISAEEIYAILGVVVGHELSHSIASKTIYYDKNGTYIPTSILPEEDLDLYKSAQEKFVNYYNSELTTGISQDGSVVLDEAIADNFGLQVVVNLLESKGNIDFKKFFVLFANYFISKVTMSYYLKVIDEEETHPAGPERLNLLLRNCLKFQQIYKFSKIDGMYRSAEDIIRVL